MYLRKEIMNPKIAFFDAKNYDIKSFNAENKKYSFEISYFENKLNSKTCYMAKDHNVVCAFVNDNLNENVINQLKEYGIKLIALRCAGYNNVDFKAAFQKIHVTRVPAYSPYAVAEHALALMLTLNRKIHKAYLRTREGNFSLNGLLGFDMHGKTAGIVGTGKIARCLISALQGMGLTILAYDPYPDEAYAASAGIKYVSIEDLYASSDIISLHCPLNENTTKMINQNAIAKMKTGVMIVNTGRGKLIDTQALIGGLKSGKIGSAGLDVYEEESNYFFEDKSDAPITDDILARLLTFSNVVVTSHQAFFTAEALSNIAQVTLDNISDFVSGEMLKNEICYKCSTDNCRKKQNKRCF
jgi:D-lactate dehydrogenase